MLVGNVVGHEQGHQLTEKEINHQIKLAVETVSKNSIYQKKLIVFLMILSLFVSLSTIGTPFLYMNPIFECEGIEGTVNEDIACHRRETCTLKNNFTLASHMDLICGKKKEARNLIQTATGLGTWGGIFLAGIIGDWKGKRLGLVLSIGMAAFAAFLRILGAYLNSLVMMIVCETLTGMAYKSITMLSFIMMTRFLTVPHYQVSSIAWYIAGGGTGQIIIAIFNSFLPAWINFAILLLVPLFLLFVVSYFLLEEDPIFLFGVGRYDECREVVNRVGERNTATLQALGQANMTIHQMEALIVASASQKRDKDSLDQNPTISRPHPVPQLKLKLNFQLIFFFLALGCCGLCSNLTFNSLQYGVQSLGSSYSINLVTMGIAQMAGYFTMTLLIRRDINRKSGIIFSSIIYCTLGLMFLFPFTSHSEVLQTVLVFTLRYFGCWIYSFFARMKVDSFPEKLQTSLMGVIELLSNFGKIISPTLVQISTDYHVNPITSSNFIRILIGTIPIFFINEEIITNPPMEEHIQEEQEQKD